MMLRWLTIVLLCISCVGLGTSAGIHLSTFWRTDLGGVAAHWRLVLLTVFTFGATVVLSAARGENLKNLPVPRWLALVLWLYLASTMAWIYVSMDGGSPKEANGRFELVEHGRFVRTLSLLEYDRAITAELRLLTGFLACFNGISTVALWRLQSNMRRGFREVQVLPERF